MASSIAPIVFLSLLHGISCNPTPLIQMGDQVKMNCTSSLQDKKSQVQLTGRILSNKPTESPSSGNSGSGMNSLGPADSRGPKMVSFTGTSGFKNGQGDDKADACGIMNKDGLQNGGDKTMYGGNVKSFDDRDPSCNLRTLTEEVYNAKQTQTLLVVFALGGQQLSVAPNDIRIQEKSSVFLVDPLSQSAEFKAWLGTDQQSMSCFLPQKNPDDEANANDSILNNFSRTSVLFVSVSFIILMVISLAWLVFYYVQRFRYAHAKDRLARRLFNAAKKALTKIPAKSLRQGDKELDSDCPVCIEPYHAGDVIRILPCKHVFHKTCVDPWLLEHRTCPMCKMDILKAFGYHFGHSEESVRDADQISAGGQSTDGGSGSGAGTGGRSGSGGQHGFPMSLPTDSDLHDPFFPSPIPSPSLLQPVLHSSNAQSFNIIPLTVHRHPGSTGFGIGGARGSDSSADSAEHWATSAVIQRQHSAEVHHGPFGVVGASNVETQTSKSSSMDDNHNETSHQRISSSGHRRGHHHNHHQPQQQRHRESIGAKPSTTSSGMSHATAVSSSSSSSSTSSAGARRQSLFHSRSAGMLQPVNTVVDSGDSDDGQLPSILPPVLHLDGKKRRHIKQQQQPDEKPAGKSFSAIVSRGRSASQTIPPSSGKARVAVSTTPPPTASGHSGTTVTTTVVGRASSASLASSGSNGSSSSSSSSSASAAATNNSDCVVIGVVNSNSMGRIISSKPRRAHHRNAVADQHRLPSSIKAGSASLESL